MHVWQHKRAQGHCAAARADVLHARPGLMCNECIVPWLIRLVSAADGRTYPLHSIRLHLRLGDAASELQGTQAG